VSIETCKLSVIETDTGPRLLGRERELAELDRFLATSAVHGGALLVRGAPGNGTSTLMLAAKRLARRQGARILRAAGVRSEMDLPFAALHQILRPLLGRTGALPRPQRDALLSTFGMRELVPRDGFLIVPLRASSHLSRAGWAVVGSHCSSHSMMGMKAVWPISAGQSCA